MSALPLANVRLTKVEGTGFSTDMGLAEGADTTRWVGNASAYLAEVERDVTGAERDEITQTYIVVRTGIAVEREDTVTFTDRGTTRTRKVRDIAEFRFGSLQKVWLEDE